MSQLKTCSLNFYIRNQRGGSQSIRPWNILGSKNKKYVRRRNQWHKNKRGGKEFFLQTLLLWIEDQNFELVKTEFCVIMTQYVSELVPKLEVHTCQKTHSLNIKMVNVVSWERKNYLVGGYNDIRNKPIYWLKRCHLYNRSKKTYLLGSLIY